MRYFLLNLRQSFFACAVTAFALLLSAASERVQAQDAVAPQTAAPQTERQYLSGRGPKDAVPWGFSVTGGRRAGEQTTIPVPSQWEQHGFGTYNYGEEGGAKSTEHGLYRLNFAVPQAWQGRNIRLVFDGVMTDASVKVNGRVAGPTHHGAFYRFRTDITSLVRVGATDNLLEVDVAKASANSATNIAERNADYWVFGGIFRPVWLEAVPAQWLEHVALDARADGVLTADVHLGAVRDATRIEAQVVDSAGAAVGAPFSTSIPNGGTGEVRLATQVQNPRLWTAETPNLYSLRLTLLRGDAALHTRTERFGFRTLEARPGQGFFLNGQRILLKGVNRHSFRPDTGRALTREDCYEDVRLLKTMNMNAVRMSHYPPDEAFLEACDELGLYVLDELSGWQRAHDTEVGRRLVRETVERDVNHPSILFWANGNEGGWNRALDAEFALYDPQKRLVLHPWETFNGIDTAHYPSYGDVVRRLSGPNIFMPTEFIHALFDGGAGSGLEDYWTAISTSPRGGGGFIWVLADEGIARTDQGGRIDVFGTYAPDGIVGPRHEKKGSFYTVRDIFSPVQIAAPQLNESFNGTLAVTNHFDFTSLSQCRFNWRLLRYRGPADKEIAPVVLSQGSASAPAVAPHASGQLLLNLPSNWREADALSLTAVGPDQKELWTWTWATPALPKRVLSPSAPPRAPRESAPRVQTLAGVIRLVAGDVTASFDAATGLLQSVRRGAKTAALTNGPRLAFARPAAANGTQWLTFASEDTATQVRRLAAPQMAHTLDIELDFSGGVSYAGFQLEISPDGQKWKTIYNGTRRSGDGRAFNFAPQPVLAVRLSNPRRSNGQLVAVKSVRLGYDAARFPAVSTSAAVVTSGTVIETASGKRVAWLESRGAAGLSRLRWTLRGDGSLKLDYNYSLDGNFLYHGISFDHAEEKISSLRWLGEGPTRVWQNRLRGTSLGIHEIARNDIQPGESWNFPEFQGYFAGLRWARLDTITGPLTIKSASPQMFLRVGTPRINHQNTTVEFPSGDLSFLHAIPAMGSKFVTPDRTGPASAPAKAAGETSGTLVFSF